MKTRDLFVTAAVLAAALSFVSCSKNEPVPTTEGRQLTMTLTLPGDAGTRAVFEENKDATGKFLGLKTKWGLGDEMSVGMTGSDASTTLTAVSVSEDGKTAVFSGEVLAEWGELSDGTPFWSCYPSTDMDWRQQDGTLANLSDYDYLWFYSDYSGGKLIPNEDKTEREIFLFRFPAGFAFCDESFSGNITLEISGAMIMSVSKILDQIPATGENTIQAGPVAVSKGELTSDVYVAAGCWENPSQVNIGVSPEDGSWVKQYKLSYPTGFNSGQLYTITSVSKLQLVTEAVDMGLPSGLKWATCNLGATSPEEYGNYYAWGETAPKTDYSWGTYFDTTDEGSTFTKYATDKKTVLDPEDDAAYAALGGKFRMPTEADWQELYNNCTWDWKTTADGYASNGRLVTASNGNTIFLPAAGYRDGTTFKDAGSWGYYWSSSLHEFIPTLAKEVEFTSLAVYNGSGHIRYSGQSIRAVCD